MALTDDISQALATLKSLATQVQTTAAAHQTQIANGADALTRLGNALKSLAVSGDTQSLNVVMTEFETVNRVLLASASAQQELANASKPQVDWNQVGNDLGIVASVAVKIAMALG